jgi:hypothetical protein
MNEEGGHGIPAANIGDTDLPALAETNPEAAKEIARLEALMNRGKETQEEFFRLCQLLFDVGAVAASEYLLRRNIECDRGHALYSRLFGTAKQTEFDTAIEAFRSQFGLNLVFVETEDFLVATFPSDGGPARFDSFALLSQPCECKFGYIEQNKIEVDVTLLHSSREDVFEANECLLLFFLNGVWEIVDPIEA